MNWWSRKKVKIEKRWIRMVKFFNSFHSRNYKKENYFYNASMVAVRDRNRKCVNPNHVIIKGSLRGKDYFLQSSPMRSIENYAHKHGSWEPNIANFIYSILNNKSKEGLVIDIGANVGATTIPQAVNFPDLKFLCIEAHPEVFERLKTNISINLLDNVFCINKAVSNSANGELLTFYAQNSNASNLGLSSLMLNHDIKDYKELLVESVRVDDLDIPKNKEVFLIKVDTQGSELEVFRSCINIIKRDNPIIIFEFEEDYYSDPHVMRGDISKFFEDLGYALYTVPTSENVMFRLKLDNYYHGDIIAVPMNRPLIN